MLHEMILTAAETHPDRVAVVHADRSLTYRDLVTDVRRCAGALTGLGLRPGDRVLLALPNCVEFVVAYFAVARQAGIVQAVDPWASIPEFERYLRDGRPTVVITSVDRAPDCTRAVQRLLPDTTVVVVGDAPGHLSYAQMLAGWPDGVEPSAGRAGPDVDLAHPYSSGSTGIPRRIRRTQANQIAEAEHVVTTAAIGPNDVLLCAVPLFHALGQYCCLIVAARAAATLVLVEPTGGADRQAAFPAHAWKILDEIARRGVTIFPAVPYMFEALAQLDGDDRMPPSVRLCVSGGNFLSETTFNRFLNRFGLPIRQTYGSSEAGSVSWNCAPEAEVSATSVGAPLTGVTVRILDERGVAVRAGTPGMIAVRSAAVMPGYVDPVPDEEVFRDGFYLTGDLGTLDAAGQLRVTGRQRLLIDSGGHKVNPVEVEEVLLSHPAVRDAVVVGVPVQGRDELVTAVTVVDRPVDGSDLAAHCRSQLAGYKVPRRFLIRDRLPRSPLGKVLREQVRADAIATGAAAAPGRDAGGPARTEPADIAAYLTAQVRTLTGYGAAGAGVDLSAAGLDSIMGVQLSMAIAEHLGVSVGLVELFGARDVAELAELIGYRMARAAPVVPVLATGATEHPLSANQLLAWQVYRIDPGSAANNRSIAARLNEVDAGVLRGAFQTLLDRHAVLRTTFSERDGVPYQRVAARLPVDFAELPAGGWSAEHLTEHLLAEAFRPFDLHHQSPMRVRLFPDAPGGPLLLLTTHHIAADFWSLTLLVGELARAYTALRAGRQPDLPPVRHTYIDYASWLVRTADGPAGEAAWAYWRDRLAHLPPSSGLAHDRTRPTVPGFRGNVRFQPLEPRLVAGLRRLAAANHASLFAVLLTAFQVLVARYTRQAEVAVGVTSTGRVRPEFRDVVGDFVNPVVIRTGLGDVLAEPSAVELLSSVQRALREALDHQAVPFATLVNRLRPRREPGRPPLVDLLVAHNRAHRRALDGMALFLGGPAGRRLRLGDLELESVQLPQLGVVYDLTALVYESDDGVSVGWEYNTDLFDEGTVAGFSEAYAAVLASFVADAGQPVGRLAVLSPERRGRLLDDSVGAPVPAVVPVHETIAGHAARQPARIAIRGPDGELTYGALERRVRAVAGALRAAGVGVEMRVAICLPRSTDWPVAALGVLRCGAAFVPLDPYAPAQRLRWLLADCAASAVVLSAATPAPARAVVADLGLASVDAASAAAGNEAFRPSAEAGNLAYVMYTSGSTGRPKGVLVEHGSLANYLRWAAAEFGLGNGSTPLHTPITFDLAITSLLGPLVAGGSVLVVPGQREATDPGVLLAGEQRYAMVKVTPAHLALMSRTAPPERWAARIATLVVGGELLTHDTAGSWVRHCRLVNEYGPTEATVASSAAVLTPADLAPGAVAPVGRPISGVRQYVLEPRMEPAPTGALGQVFIGGAGVVRGYANDPRATADRFVPDPFGPPGGRLYRTGDLGRYLPDGSVQVSGRVDHEVKVRGYRIAPGEVEAAFATHPAVRAVAVVAPGEPARRRLVAHIVAADHATDADLREWAAGWLPDHLMPTEIVRHAELPLTPAGKVDRAALSAFAAAGTAAGTAPAAASAVEAVLAAIWADVLGMNEVGVHDNFFGLGGDSISNLLVCGQARNAGVEITPRQLFTHPTIHELAAVARAVDPTLRGGQPVNPPDVRPVPLTPIQHWFFELAAAEPEQWNQVVVLRARRQLDPGLVRRALDAVVAEHEALRLRFTRTAAGWRQTVHSHGAAPAFRHLPDPASDPDADRRTLHANLNLSDGPTVAALLREEADGPLLAIAVHHLAVDVVSWRVLLDDLASAYQQLENGAQVRLPAPVTTFSQWAVAVRDWVQSAEAHAELDHWLRVARSLPPAWEHRPTGAAGDAYRHIGTVSAALTVPQTGHLVRDRDAGQVLALLLTAVAQVLADRTGESVVALAVEGHGRERFSHASDLDLSRTVGWFASLYPVVIDLGRATPGGGAPGAGDTGPGILSRGLDALPHKGFGYLPLRYLVGDTARAELARVDSSIQATVTYFGRIDAVLGGGSGLFDLAETGFRNERSPANRQPYPLDVVALVVDGAFTVRLSYSDRDLDEPTASRLVAGIVDRVARHASALPAGDPIDRFRGSGLDREQLAALISAVTTGGDEPEHHVVKEQGAQP